MDLVIESSVQKVHQMNSVPQHLFKTFAAVICLHSSAHCTEAFAPSTEPHELTSYTVQPGDTLASLIGDLQLPEDSAQALHQLKTINPSHSITALRPGHALKVPQSWLRQDSSPLRVSQMTCTGTLLPELSDGRVLAPDQWLAEGSTIKVPIGCKVGLLLQDGSRLYLPSGAVVRLDVLRQQVLHKAPLVQIRLLQGRLGLDIYKQRPARSRIEVQTPKATTGVRGTQFRVGLSPQQQDTLIEVLEGKVQAHGNSDQQATTIDKLEGLVISAEGQSHEPEKLLPAPQLSHNSQTQGWVFLPVTHASAYAIEKLANANTSVEETPHITPSPYVLPPATPTSAAELYRAASITPSGLKGPSATYAMCGQTVCNIPFDLSEAQGHIRRFELKHIQGQTSQTMLSTQISGTMASMIAAGLKPGHYQWSIEYNSSSSSAQPSQAIRTQGDFILSSPRAVTSQ
jgi:hypothetical protein